MRRKLSHSNVVSYYCQELKVAIKVTISGKSNPISINMRYEPALSTISCDDDNNMVMFGS